MRIMKKYLILLTGFSFFIQLASAQVDRTKAPSAGPAPKIQVAKYESFTLKNGLKVFVVENHKLPVVAYDLVFDNDPVLQGDKAGYVDIFGELLSRGTTTRSKEQLDEAIDFIGAEIYTGPDEIYATSLKKHNEQLLQLMADILLNPSFPEDEFEKIKTQTLSGLAANKTDPTAIAENMRNAINYGAGHPYGEVTTEQTIANITLDDIRNYYKDNFMPNVAYLAIVGDITKAEVQPLIEKYFGAWAKGSPKKNKYQTPQPPSTVHIHMHDRPGSVQASLNLVYPVQLKVGDADYIKTRVLANILGGGSTGRLYKNLREGHGYTYGAYSQIKADKLVGLFYAGAEVRNMVADSSVFQFIYELNRIATQGVTREELDAVKKEMTGTFARSLENPQNIANFAINIERYKLSKTYYEDYLTSLNNITLEEMNEAAKKYVLPYNFHLIVVGSRDSIEKNLMQYDADQKISFYDNYGKPTKQIKDAPDGVTAETVIDTYIKTIGGKDNINKIADMTTKGSASMQGFPLSMTTVQKAPDKFYLTVMMGDQLMQKVVCNGTTGKRDGMEGAVVMNEKEVQETKMEAVIVMENRYKELNIKATLLGVDYQEDQDAYLIEFVYPTGSKERVWYSVKSGLKIKALSFGQQQVTVVYNDYKAVNGVMFPHYLKQDFGGMVMDVQISSIEINTSVGDDLFNIK